MEGYAERVKFWACSYSAILQRSFSHSSKEMWTTTRFLLRIGSSVSISPFGLRKRRPIFDQMFWWGGYNNRENNDVYRARNLSKNRPLTLREYMRTSLLKMEIKKNAKILSRYQDSNSRRHIGNLSHFRECYRAPWVEPFRFHSSKARPAQGLFLTPFFFLHPACVYLSRVPLFTISNYLPSCSAAALLYVFAHFRLRPLKLFF